MARGVNEEFAPPTINPGAITCRGDRALKTAYQTDSESGKEAYKADTEEVLNFIFFRFLWSSLGCCEKKFDY